MARSHVCPKCGEETSRVRAAMDVDLRLMLAACPRCGAVLVRSRDRVALGVRRATRVAWSLLFLVVRGGALAGAAAACAGMAVMTAAVFGPVDSYGIRDEIGREAVFGSMESRRAMVVGVSAVFFGAGMLARGAMGHLGALRGLTLFAVFVAIGAGLDGAVLVIDELRDWLSSSSNAVRWPPVREWLWRLGAASLGAPGLVAGWFIGGVGTPMGEAMRAAKWRWMLTKARARRRHA